MCTRFMVASSCAPPATEDDVLDRVYGPVPAAELLEAAEAAARPPGTADEGKPGPGPPPTVEVGGWKKLSARSAERGMPGISLATLRSFWPSAAAAACAGGGVRSGWRSGAQTRGAS